MNGLIITEEVANVMSMRCRLSLSVTPSCVEKKPCSFDRLKKGPTTTSHSDTFHIPRNLHMPEQLSPFRFGLGAVRVDCEQDIQDVALWNNLRASGKQDGWKKIKHKNIKIQGNVHIKHV